MPERYWSTRCRESASFLKYGACSTVIPIYQEGNHKNGNNQSDRTNSPARRRAPIQTATTSKQQKQHNYDKE